MLRERENECSIEPPEKLGISNFQSRTFSLRRSKVILEMSTVTVNEETFRSFNPLMATQCSCQQTPNIIKSIIELQLRKFYCIGAKKLN